MELLAVVHEGWQRCEEDEPVAREQIWVGIDVGKESHHACAVDERGKVIFSRKVPNGQAAVEDLIARAAGTAERVQWAMDMTSGTAALLLTLLHTSGYSVTYVPGRLVNRMSGAFAGEGKTDAKDARTIAETARLRSDLTVVPLADELVADLQVMTSRREDLREDWVRGVNRLRALLASIFPGLERALDYTARGPLLLLTGFQTPAGVRAAGVDGVTAFLLAQGASPVTRAAIAAKAVAAAEEQMVTLPGEDVTARLVARLAADLLNLDHQIKDLDKQLAARFEQHPHAARISSVTGFGPVHGATLLAESAGDPHATFGTSSRMAAYAGLAPVPRDSGRVTGNMRQPKRYQRRLRRVFYMAAIVSIRQGGASKTFYDRKRAEGKRHNQAVLALARRLVDVMWALLRDGREFQIEPPRRALAAA